MGVVSTLADILPGAEEIDLRWILEALPGLDHRAERADLHAIERPGVEFASGRRLPTLHSRRSFAQFRFEAARIQVGRLNDMGVG